MTSRTRTRWRHRPRRPTTNPKEPTKIVIASPIIEPEKPDPASEQRDGPVADEPAEVVTLREAFAGLPEEWIADLRPACIEAARVAAAVRAVRERHAAAQADIDRAVAELDLDALGASALQLQSWAHAALVLTQQAGVDPSPALAAVRTAQAAVTNAAATVKLSEPRYTAENAAWTVLPNSWRANPAIERPTPTMASLAAGRRWDALLTTCSYWRSSFDAFLQSVGSTDGSDALHLLQVAWSLIEQAEALVVEAEAFETERQHADDERTSMGLRWTPPPGVAAVAPLRVDLLGRAQS